MELKYPDKKQMQIEFLHKYRDEFLRINGLKVGDKITMEFPYEVARSGYKRRGQEIYTYKKSMEGVLKVDDNGVLFAESIDFVDNYTTKTKGRSTEYVCQKIKSKVKFGTGFVF